MLENIFWYYMMGSAILAIPTSIIGLTVVAGLEKAGKITTKTSCDFSGFLAIMGLFFPVAGILVPLVLVAMGIFCFIAYGSDFVAYLISRFTPEDK